MFCTSPFYPLSILFALGVVALLWRGLIQCSEKTKRTLVLALMLMNTCQHFFKSVIYPHLRGDGFTALSTAYNICAALIILSPFAFAVKSHAFRNFIFFTGSVAGLSVIVYPAWFMQEPVTELGWEFIRFYFCHLLLFLSSCLPLLWGLHKTSYRKFWHIAPFFLLALCLILLNNTVAITLGLFPYTDPARLYEGLVQTDPCALMGPPENLPWLRDLAALFTPDYFLGNNPTGKPAPILWCIIPLFLALNLGAFLLFVPADLPHVREDLSRLFSKQNCKKKKSTQ